MSEVWPPELRLPCPTSLQNSLCLSEKSILIEQALSTL